MKKTLFVALLAIFSLSAMPALASKSTVNENETTTENKLSEEEISAYKARLEEIRDMDKSEMTALEKKELKNEVKEMKERMRKDGIYFYLGGSTLIIIILILLLV